MLLQNGTLDLMICLVSALPQEAIISDIIKGSMRLQKIPVANPGGPTTFTIGDEFYITMDTGLPI